MEYKLKRTLRPHPSSPVLCTSFSPNGQRIACGCKDGRLIIWSVDTGDTLWTCRGSGALLSLLWVPSSKLDRFERVLCGFQDGSLVVVDVFEVHTHPAFSLIALLISTTQERLDMTAYRMLRSPLECMAFRSAQDQWYLATGGCYEISVSAEKGACASYPRYCNLQIVQRIRWNAYVYFHLPKQQSGMLTMTSMLHPCIGGRRNC